MGAVTRSSAKSAREFEAGIQRAALQLPPHVREHYLHAVRDAWEQQQKDKAASPRGLSGLVSRLTHGGH